MPKIIKDVVNSFVLRTSIKYEETMNIKFKSAGSCLLSDQLVQREGNSQQSIEFLCMNWD